jgi:putative phosphoribosyl transferase
MFKDRTEAGKLLAARLQKYSNQLGVVLAVPRGGVPVAYEVAKVLQLPLELVLIKKLGHPMNKEYAIGAVGLTGRIVVPHKEVPETYIEKETQRVRLRLKEMQEKFMAGREPADISGKIVILIDDGIATGNTLLATVRILRKSHPAKIIVGVPVASSQAAKILSTEVDELIVVLIPETFHGVGSFYNNFTQVSDEEVLFYLNKLQVELKKAS